MGEFEASLSNRHIPAARKMPIALVAASVLLLAPVVAGASDAFNAEVLTGNEQINVGTVFDQSTNIGVAATRTTYVQGAAANVRVNGSNSANLELGGEGAQGNGGSITNAATTSNATYTDSTVVQGAFGNLRVTAGSN
ncbi:MAG: hypothetical protein HQL42_14090 [Alphaproteobacteria bacterium]|nr:hypothetical protein [Alphaproteobacteria bacterium]